MGFKPELKTGRAAVSSRARCLCLMVMLLVVSIVTGCASAPAEDPERRLEDAIEVLRSLEHRDLSREEARKKSEDIQQAWSVIEEIGKPGIQRLKEELERVRNKDVKAHYFRLNAGYLLWDMRGLEEAETIASIWESVPLHKQYNYVFYPAFEAAKKQEDRAIPMLKACLGDEEGEVRLRLHAMRLRWPRTIEFIWGVFGPKGLPPLRKILETSRDPVKLKSAMWLLAKAHDLESLPRIRKLAKERQDEVHRMAVRCLGLYGHPEDFDLLISGLDSDNPDEVWSHLYALYEYGDLRAVPKIAPLLQSENKRVLRETGAALMHLLTPQSLDALQSHASEIDDQEKIKQWKRRRQNILREGGLSWEEYTEKEPDDKKKVVATIRKKRRWGTKADAEKVSREEFLQAVRTWTEEGRLHAGGEDHPSLEECVSVAKPEDISRLLKLRASLYPRLSDECLYEVKDVQQLINYLGRSRYRKVPGVCEKVEPK